MAPGPGAPVSVMPAQGRRNATSDGAPPERREYRYSSSE